MTKLFLIPTTLANPIYSNAVLLTQLPLIHHLKYFIVETAKTGRAHLKHLNLNTPIQELNIQELNKHQEDLGNLIAQLLSGQDMGLISDCGLPAIADPGNKVVRLAHEHGIEVVPLVGPSSLMLALMASGLNGQSFAFNGYLPIDKTVRLDKIKHLVKQVSEFGQSQIFIETPFRNQQLFETLINTLPGGCILGVAINLMCNNQQIIAKTINKWKLENTLPVLHKQEVVFVFGY